VAGRGAAPALVGAAGGIRLLLLVVLAWLGEALLPVLRRAGALTPPDASSALAVKPQEGLKAVSAGYEGREHPRRTRASLQLQRLA
jgi:hypothetical protein